MPALFTRTLLASAIVALGMLPRLCAAFDRVIVIHFGKKADEGDGKSERLPPPKKDGKNEPDEKSDNITKPKGAKESPAPDTSPAQPAFGLGLTELLRLTLEQNPRLTQARYAADAASGRALQAGLYPNPTVGVIFDELFDRQGPAGIITAPQVTQEIVTAGKLRLSRAAAEREVDQAVLAVLSQRYARFAAVRQAYYDILTLRRRVEILEGLVKLAEQSVATTEKLLKAGQVARLDLVQLEVERERFGAEHESARRELPAAFRRLAAAVGAPQMPEQPLVGVLGETLPSYELGPARELISRAHPDVLAAKKGVDRARLRLERARVEPIPNVTVQVGYVRQNQNKSNDALIGFSVPVPCWNRNEGNIAAAQAEVGEAIQQVGRAETELVERLAEAHRTYAAARRRAELFAKNVLPRAKESYDIALKGYRGGQFDYLRVLEAQRAYSQADLEYVRSLGEAWRAAAELSGLLLEEAWPNCQPTEPVPAER